MNKKKIALWAINRSTSTVFERIFIERGDTTVFHEPFALYYYNSSERRNDRYIHKQPWKPEYEFDKILRKIFDNHTKSIWFMKDMAYHVTNHISFDFVNLFRNTFLIRDPKDALLSHFRLAPDFTLEEAGYSELKRLFLLSIETGQSPIVIDADDFRKHPEKIILKYCELLGIPYLSHAMQWKKQEVDLWSLSRAWHLDAINSTSVLPPNTKIQDPIVLPESVNDMIKLCTDDYLEMYKYRIIV